ncbi:tRNA pseudouridine32 synthase / 23S rRNA pseudouridine746 synthase [Fistulifera solaris]|uniref:tRNA pseudouridine32 synthase / 23S rRNA pseudouridine746 synthase n=1 Tax=Fistulifera solaris TaxID=1519565 RepID=A0A1Z5JMU4_FISSO|nr:tRNA pseudouridine32 synthase / 23S rRNA pseudouridine746 synthase [Fistulifera solaris]|eukprot:GAX15108.1 tRNA pseudouridine32 synthase / 23S rRNA pseudouridine746 synthase [Fistulifera solaris]
MNRTVTVQLVPWISNLLPLQTYSADSVPPVRAITDLDLMNMNSDYLSHSAAQRLDVYSSLSSEEQRKLQMKIAAETRASRKLDPSQHLHILYFDDHICVASKPSGILSVPGPRRNPSLAGLVHEVLSPSIDIDKMVVHRLDMDTSGIIVYALTEAALRILHDAFRNRQVKKVYQALLCGHVPMVSGIEVDIALERDPLHPPFMRVAQSRSSSSSVVHPAFHKFIDQAPKPSFTLVDVRSHEYLQHPGGRRLPVTRVELTPFTGRTHQLRVHTAALGYPILGDDIYGYLGEGDCGIPRSADAVHLEAQLHELGMPLCLHAEQLSFFHPFTGAPMLFQAKAPF